ncbi:DUF6159 family protein [Aeromicrobium sp.]|uniref:DUF6159 family protein n=1 Tax=Aeromicrobium sp. TaxID=1871063 RepID=UPI002FC7EA87
MSYPVGWYPDYALPGQRRYWDGEQWTHYVHLNETDSGTSRKRRKLPKFRPSEQLVGATYRMLFADRSMIALLFVGSLVAATASGAILFPAIYWGHVEPGWSSGGVLGVLVAGSSLGAASFVFQFVGGAVVAAAHLRAEGRPATARDALGIAWGRRRQLLAWALVSTLVGVLIRMLERMGIGGLVAALTLNLGWAFATVFATPVIMIEGTMPVATVRRSAALLRGHFTVTLISAVTLALPWIAMAVVSVTIGVAGGITLALAEGMAATLTGGLLLAAGVIGFCFFCAVSSALGTYLETLLYRYAVGLPVPGVDQHLLPPLAPA